MCTGTSETLGIFVVEVAGKPLPWTIQVPCTCGSEDLEATPHK